MGWWSEAIMGGDEPLDDFGAFCDVAVPGQYLGGNAEVLTREALDAALPEIRRRIRGRKIALQALGVTIMERGANLPDDLRAEIIGAAACDEWAREDEVRREHMEAFIAKIRAYQPGSPVDCKREGGLLSRGGGTSLVENMLRSRGEGG